jgi:hypothetical protein
LACPLHIVDAGTADDSLTSVSRQIQARLSRHCRHHASDPRAQLLRDYTGEEYDRVADLNLRGTFFFLREFGAS